MNSIVRLSALAGMFLVVAGNASSANAQYGYHYSGYSSYPSVSYGYSAPAVSYSSYYAPGYTTTSTSVSSYYYATPPAAIAPQFSAPAYNTYVVPQYYRTTRVITPPVMPVPVQVYRRPVVYAPAIVPRPGFGIRYGF